MSWLKCGEALLLVCCSGDWQTKSPPLMKPKSTVSRHLVVSSSTDVVRSSSLFPILDPLQHALDPLFGMGANVALIFSGQFVRYVSNMRASLAPGVDAWAVSLRYLMAGVVGSGGVMLAAYKYIQDNIVPKTKAAKQSKAAPKKKKERMTLKESAQFLFSSPYIRDLALLVISYGMCINIVEVSWKAKLKVSHYVSYSLITMS